MSSEEHQVEEEVGPLVDGIRVVDKHRLALVRTSPIAIVVLLAASILLATGIAFTLTHFKGAREAVQTVIPESDPALPTLADIPRFTVVPDTNVRVQLPLSWHETRSNDALPSGVATPRIRLAHPDLTCRIVYASIETNTLRDAYRKSGDYTDIARDARFVGRIERAVPVTNGSGENDTASSTYQAGEIAFAYQPLFYDNGSNDATRDAWVLYAHSEEPITPFCTEVFAELVRSYTPHFEAVTLTPDMTGTLTVEDYTDIAPDTGTVLLWRDTGGSARLVTTLDSGMINKPTVVGETLYYVGTEGLLKVYRLIDTLPPQVVPLPLAPDASVHDFRMQDGVVEYLAGSWCVQTPDTCDLTHASFDLATQEHIALEEHTTAPLLAPEQPSLHQSLQLTDGVFTAGTELVPGILPARVPVTLPVYGE